MDYFKTVPNFNKALKNTNRIYSLLKKFNFEGTSFPGKILRQNYKSFLSDAQDYAISDRFAITGTNGKTTTAGILAQILKEAEHSVIHNELGANMPNGIATAVALGLYKILKDNPVQRVDNYVIECDEAYLAPLFNEMKFDYLLVTNLFRDQLDRYGELDITKKKIQKGIELNEDITLILNADDPTLSDIDHKLADGRIRKKIYYGIENITFAGYDKVSKSPSETVYCSKCTLPLQYKKRFYSQLGRWYCACGNKRPEPEIKADVKVFPDHFYLYITYKERPYTFKVNLTGLYNAYNALGAISCALINGVERRFIDKALENYTPAFGRNETVYLNGRPATVYLIKNPVGASEVLRGLKNIENASILISINDNYADGRDVSWLWDSDFESLRDFKGNFFLTGSRADDMALRLKYAGCDTGSILIDSNIKRSLEDAVEKLQFNEKLVILTTYTSLLKMTKLFKGMKK